MKKLAGVLIIGVALFLIPSAVLVTLGAPGWTWTVSVLYGALFGFACLAVAQGLDGAYSVAGSVSMLLAFVVLPSVFMAVVIGAPWWSWVAFLGLVAAVCLLIAGIVLSVKFGLRLMGVK